MLRSQANEKGLISSYRELVVSEHVITNATINLSSSLQQLKEQLHTPPKTIKKLLIVN